MVGGDLGGDAGARAYDVENGVGGCMDCVGLERTDTMVGVWEFGVHELNLRGCLGWLGIAVRYYNRA